MNLKKSDISKKNAYLFILILGFVSLFSDFTHEGARSVYGAYLAILGASALAVSTVSGLGEFIGQGLRLATGYLTDKTRKYWLFVFIGYSFNLIVIPLLAFIPADGWLLACALILLERVGKAFRAPAKSTLVSFAGKEIGAGKTFAFHEALDQLGACLGPLLASLILTIKGGNNVSAGYRICFLVLGGSAVISMVFLIFAQRKYPDPAAFERAKGTAIRSFSEKTFWIYIAAIGLIAAGFCDFPLIAYHLGGTFTSNIIPLLYSLAMGVDAVAALIFGWLYDRKGIAALIIAIVITSFFGVFLFVFNGSAALIIGLMIWGIGMGAQESILKAVVAGVVSLEKRASAYGIFNAGFGLFWFLGSLLLGWLYGKSLYALAFVSMGLELASVPLLVIVGRKTRQGNAAAV